MRNFCGIILYACSRPKIFLTTSNFMTHNNAFKNIHVYITHVIVIFHLVDSKCTCFGSSEGCFSNQKNFSKRSKMIWWSSNIRHSKRSFVLRHLLATNKSSFGLTYIGRSKTILDLFKKTFFVPKTSILWSKTNTLTKKNGNWQYQVFLLRKELWCMIMSEKQRV